MGSINGRARADAPILATISYSWRSTVSCPCRCTVRLGCMKREGCLLRTGHLESASLLQSCLLLMCWKSSMQAKQLPTEKR